MTARGDTLVVGLCAAWCGTCREFQPIFERLAASRGDAAFVWLDIEDDADIAGDIDVETFPALAVYRGDEPVFFGATLPQEGTVARLLAAMIEGEPAGAAVPEAIAALPRLLRGRR